MVVLVTDFRLIQYLGSAVRDFEAGYQGEVVIRVHGEGPGIWASQGGAFASEEAIAPGQDVRGMAAARLGVEADGGHQPVPQHQQQG